MGEVVPIFKDKIGQLSNENQIKKLTSEIDWLNKSMTNNKDIIASVNEQGMTIIMMDIATNNLSEIANLLDAQQEGYRIAVRDRYVQIMKLRNLLNNLEL
jgi:hypothetical protein